MWHDSFICDKTYSCVTCLIHIRLDLFLCDMTHSCVTWLTCDMTHSHVTWLIHMWRGSFICVTWLMHMWQAYNISSVLSRQGHTWVTSHICRGNVARANGACHTHAQTHTCTHTHTHTHTNTYTHTRHRSLSLSQTHGLPFFLNYYVKHATSRTTRTQTQIHIQTHVHAPIPIQTQWHTLDWKLIDKCCCSVFQCVAVRCSALQCNSTTVVIQQQSEWWLINDYDFLIFMIIVELQLLIDFLSFEWWNKH